MRLLILTGLPATGKSTLALLLATRYRLPLLAKDAFKETLLAGAGGVDAARSRQLSDRSFELLFAGLRQIAATGADVVVEGNFRSGRHEAALLVLPAARIAQVLCRVEETERLRRIGARAGDPARHPGHGDARAPRDASNDAFLELPGERLLFNGFGAGDAARAALLARLDAWWRTDSVR